MLLKVGADPSAATLCGGETALIAAARRGYRAIVEMLLTHGADTRARDKDEGTALDAARAWGHEDIAQLLLIHVKATPLSMPTKRS
jgi:ankyrin repeat protein